MRPGRPGSIRPCLCEISGAARLQRLPRQPWAQGERRRREPCARPAERFRAHSIRFGFTAAESRTLAIHCDPPPRARSHGISRPLTAARRGAPFPTRRIDERGAQARGKPGRRALIPARWEARRGPRARALPIGAPTRSNTRIDSNGRSRCERAHIALAHLRWHGRTDYAVHFRAHVRKSSMLLGIR